MFWRTFFLVALVEMGSASQFMLAGLAINSRYPWMVWLGGISALVITSVLAIWASKWLNKLPFSTNVISGGILVCMGVFFLLKR